MASRRVLGACTVLITAGVALMAAAFRLTTDFYSVFDFGVFAFVGGLVMLGVEEELEREQPLGGRVVNLPGVGAAIPDSDPAPNLAPQAVSENPGQLGADLDVSSRKPRLRF